MLLMEALMFWRFQLYESEGLQMRQTQRCPVKKGLGAYEEGLIEVSLVP